MQVGAHVFGDNRLGLWCIENSGLKSKLEHVLPRLRALLPVTDIFLPGHAATREHRDLVRAHGFYVSVYTIPHSETPRAYAARSLRQLASIGGGALEMNIEIPDSQIKGFVSEAVARIRETNPNLRVRVNIAPYKAQFLPAELVRSDPNLYVIEQAYLGNMDAVVPADHCYRDMIDYGIPPHKASVMYAAYCSPRPGLPRAPVLPAVQRYRGAIYSDDLLIASGLLR